MVCLAALAAGGERPDFSGTWTLDEERSDFGKVPGGQPTARTDVIEQHGLELVQTLYLSNGDRRDTTVYHYVTDSTECVNRVGGSDIKSRVWWHGDTLQVASKAKLLMVIETTLRERWRLSAGGDTLSMSRRVTWPMGHGEQTLVFEKQPAAAAEPQPADRAGAREP